MALCIFSAVFLARAILRCEVCFSDFPSVTVACFVRSVSILSLVGSAIFLVPSVNSYSGNSLVRIRRVSSFIRSVNIRRLVVSASFLVRSVSILTLVGSGSTRADMQEAIRMG